MKKRILILISIILICSIFIIGIYFKLKYNNVIYLSCNIQKNNLFKTKNTELRGYIINFSNKTIFDIQEKVYVKAIISNYEIEFEYEEAEENAFLHILSYDLTINRITGRIYGSERQDYTYKDDYNLFFIEGVCTPSKHLLF